MEERNQISDSHMGHRLSKLFIKNFRLSMSKILLLYFLLRHLLGQWAIEVPEPLVILGDYGLIAKSKAHHHAISSKFGNELYLFLIFFKYLSYIGH